MIQREMLLSTFFSGKMTAEILVSGQEPVFSSTVALQSPPSVPPLLLVLPLLPQIQIIQYFYLHTNNLLAKCGVRQSDEQFRYLLAFLLLSCFVNLSQS